MTIAVSDLKFFQAERMTDFADGGGRMTANAIESGVENQIFDDVTDQDRAAGDVSIRKVFAAVTSANTDKYLDAGVAVLREPEDPAVSVLAFSTGDGYDERADLQARIEQTITRGPRYNGWLYGQHLAGQRALLLWQRPEAPLLPAGGRVELVAQSGAVEQHSQFAWVTRVTDEVRTQYEVVNTVTIQYQVRVLTCEIAEPLAGDYAGLEPSRGDPTPGNATALVYETRYNAEAVPLYGVRPLAESAALGDFSVMVDSLYSPLIPTAFAETALPDVTPGADSAVLVAANAATVNFTTATQCVKPDASLFLGTACTPGTLSIAVSGATLTDDNGNVKLATAVIGNIDYGNGVCRFNSSCPNYGAASKTVTFKPAGRPLRVADTASQAVTTENRGYVWVLTLAPIPAPQTLRVSYRVNNQWYTLTDQGGGVLRGADSSYGSGNLSFATGTATISTGALPDVGSEIIYAWGTLAQYSTKDGSAVPPAVVRGTAAHTGLAPNSVTLEWTYNSVTYTLNDNGLGALTGTGGSGTVRYATGEWTVTPTVLPSLNTEFSLSYDHGTPYEKAFAHPLREPNGHLALTLDHTNVRANTVEVEWNLLVIDYEAALSTTVEFIAPPMRRFDPIKIARDNGAGALTISGGTNGTVNYAAGTLDFLPDVSVSLPKPIYSPKLLGTSTTSSGGGTLIVNTYRTTFDGFEYIPAGAEYPPDESGYVKVRYRTVGGDSAATETATLAQLEIDLTKGYAETAVQGSLRFRIGADLFADTAGQIYRNPAPDTGAGTLAGSLDPSSGIARIDNWTPGASNAVTLESLLTDLAAQPVDQVVFRAPISPLKSGTLQLRYSALDGEAKLKTVDGTGLLEDSDCTIRADYQLGVIRARFGRWRVDSELTLDEKAEVWYDPAHRIDFAGTLKIWQPRLVAADSIVYNAVAQTFLPPDSALLGLNAARLPPDGKALIFNSGRLVLVHHTANLAQSSLSPTQVIDCGRTRLYRAVIEDAADKRLGADQYTVDRVAGIVAMSPTLNLTGFSAPYKIVHTVADLARLVAVDISGKLSLNKALSHAYPADESRCSAVLPIGTMQARVSNLFAQSTWTSVWSDELIGSEPLAQYNDAQWPIAVSNLGAYTDRMLVKFTSATGFQVIGENLGIIGVGDTTQDCAPINSLTGQPYFTIPHQGWGSGWATGNCLRFNLIGANYPIDLIRAVQPSDPTGQDPDSVELILVGNVDQG